MARRISSQLESKKLLSNGFGSCRPGHDSTINASVMAYDIYRGFQNKEETVIAAIDLEDAYKRVDYEERVHKMMDTELDPFLVRWVASTMLPRKFALKCEIWTSDPQLEYLSRSPTWVISVACTVQYLHYRTG